MQPLGIISGTVSLMGAGIFAHLREERVETDFGPAVLFCSAAVVFIARHGTDPRCPVLPHRINHQANLAAMKKLGVREVLGVYSTGALKRHLKPGALVVPDDYIMPAGGPTAVREEPLHIVPALSEPLRRRWLDAARGCGLRCVDGGIYWQTAGPRLETRAEVAMISRFADLVGMTMASEAVIAQELGLPFAALCSVDNLAHGLDREGLSTETILRHARNNAAAILRIVTRCIETFPRT